MEDKTSQNANPSKEELEKLVRNHMIAAVGAGMIPIPAADLFAMTGVQINLVRKIAARFDVPFSQNAVKSIIGALVGGALPFYGAPLLAGAAKTIPLAGSILGLAVMPTVSAATTYAVGHVFIQHFESGGTLLTFDAKQARVLFNRLLKRGQEIPFREEDSESSAPAQNDAPSDN